MNDPYGRNIWGTPPQGNADYAFQQHIMASLKPDTGRCVVLFPHGVLFRDSESDIRKKMIEGDYVDAVIGLGKNLFYNSSMESCLLICRTKKPKARKGKIIFIDAKEEIKLERSSAYLTEKNIQKISDAYHDFSDIDGFAKVSSNKDVLSENNGILSVQLYVKQSSDKQEHELADLLSIIETQQHDFNGTLENLLIQLKDLGIK
jgi:type I restriction enzyme M protein